MRETGRRAVFLDRDGTIARYTEYCRRPEDFHLLPGTGEAIRRLNEVGLLVMVITNQSAIARRWLTWGRLKQIHQKMRRQLARVGARIDAIYVCPHHPDDGCACRKPGTAMFQQAARDFGVSLAASYVVGDRMLDVRSGRAAGSRTILVRSGHRPEPDQSVEPDYEARDLTEAVAWILQQETDRVAQASAGALDRLEAGLDTVRRRCPWLAVFAIRWMRLKHPLHPVQLRLLREHLGVRAETSEDTEALTQWIRPRFLRRLMQCVVYACYLSGRVIRLRLALHRQVRALKREPFEVLIKTCCFEPARPANGRDFYFGDLQERLVRRDVRTLLLCGNVRRGSWTAFGRAHLASPPLARMPELALLSPFAPLRLMLAQIEAAFRLRLRVRKSDDALIARIIPLASEECLAPDTARAALYFWIMKHAVRTWRPRAFITLYEGHAWEACARWGVKAHAPICQTVGYQHTAIFPESLSLTSPSTARTDHLVPDTILALGQVPLELMASGHTRDHHVRLLRFGSFRYRHANVNRPADRARRVILVVPEGFVSEVTVLFEFALACATRLPSYTFVLRCHPEVPMAVARRVVSGDLTRQPNIELSEHRHIEEDFARSSALLYRGSSAVLYAVLHGLLPLYVHVPAMLDRDPLYRMPSWRRRCLSPDDVAMQLESHEQAPLERVEAEWAQAVRYVTDYTGPVTDERIDALLAAVDLNRSAR